MGPIDALWHLLNFLLPAAGLALLAAALAKLAWRAELRGVAYRRLAAWGSGANLLVQVGGLMLFGHDGRILTYAAMVVATALALLWAGWGPGRR